MRPYNLTSAAAPRVFPQAAGSGNRACAARAGLVLIASISLVACSDSGKPDAGDVIAAIALGAVALLAVVLTVKGGPRERETCGNCGGTGFVCAHPFHHAEPGECDQPEHGRECGVCR